MRPEEPSRPPPPPLAQDLLTAPDGQTSHWEVGPVNGDAISGPEEEPLKCQDSAVELMQRECSIKT